MRIARRVGTESSEVVAEPEIVQFTVFFRENTARAKVEGGTSVYFSDVVLEFPGLAEALLAACARRAQ